MKYTTEKHVLEIDQHFFNPRYPAMLARNLDNMFTIGQGGGILEIKRIYI